MQYSCQSSMMKHIKMSRVFLFSVIFFGIWLLTLLMYYPLRKMYQRSILQVKLKMLTSNVCLSELVMCLPQKFTFLPLNWHSWFLVEFNFVVFLVYWEILHPMMVVVIIPVLLCLWEDPIIHNLNSALTFIYVKQFRMKEVQLGSHTVRSHGATVARTHMHDWLILLLLVVIEVVLYIIHPFYRFVGKDMMDDLRYPLKSNTVPFWAVLVNFLYLAFGVK